MRRIANPILLAALIFPTLAQAADKAPHPLAEARSLVINGDYAASIVAFDKVRAENPDVITPLDGDQFGAVYAVARDWEGVQKHARWMFKQFPEPERIENAERTAKAYLIYPESDDPALAAYALKLTTYAAENAKGQWVNWFYTAHALALYRNGEYKESIKWAKKTRGDEDAALTSFALPIEAMSEYALGNAKAAKKLLLQAQADFDKLHEQGTPEYANEWSNILTSKSVIDEATRAISE